MSKDVKALNSYFTGNIGELSVNLIYQKNNIVCTPLGTSDFGEDLLCDIFSLSKDNKVSIRTQFSFRTQVKTTEDIKKEGYIRRIAKGLSISLPTGLLKIWEQSYYPVVLVMWESSSDTGFWCFPTEQIETSGLENETLSISVELNNAFNNSGVQRIREQVELYYNNMYKIDKAKYQCNIYPVWMPGYRLFTSMETYKIVSDNNTKAKAVYHMADMLPAFLSSYHNCNLGSFHAGIEYSNKAQSLEQFWTEVNDFIAGSKLTLPGNEWISYIISPVELISEIDNRKISNITDWSCFSVVGNNIVSDFDYTYNLSPNYIYSEKVRATSDDQEFFVHSSGDFAVEVFSTGFSFFTRKADFQLMDTLHSKSFCILDISKYSPVEVGAIAGWCNESNYRFIELADDKDRIVISHMFFEPGSFGTLLPGTSTWKEWDALNFDSEEFFNKLPHGNPVDIIEKQRIFNKYFQHNERISDLCLLRYSQALHSEALCHNERLIRFITYIEPTNIVEYDEGFKVAEQNLKEICKHFNLYYDPYEDITDVILEVQPLITQSTQEVIAKVENIYHNLIKSIYLDNNQRKNMAFYVKYRLDRWLPESLVHQD
ncbi:MULTISPECIES: DUF4365 domain-containing protein [unclassified Sedimentibacter]|uniref:DUF4365 domain-containing protein n=1 Tax=unclassified Sedimentibacter TaxID=2649220 RepID=UPI0027E0A5AD|nr:DUF4365 domain-containing protein [Sedimentibacter sp. MB35-C1]WMJ76956.1 DUF4365 domain-containing protein [Sedimentibacter sp. MB35-C1]